MPIFFLLKVFLFFTCDIFVPAFRGVKALNGICVCHIRLCENCGSTQLPGLNKEVAEILEAIYISQY